MRDIFLIVLISQILFLSFASNAEPKRSTHREEENDHWPCIKPGLMCSTCSKISLCEQNKDGTWNRTTLETCEPEHTCLDPTISCTKDYNPQCESHADKYLFQCHQVGMFPDPFDCRYFHLCPFDDATSMKFRCPNDFFYDALTTRCVIKGTKAKCAPSIAPCRQTSQGPILANSRLHYMCLPDARERYYFPHLLYCNDDYKYINDACVDPGKTQGLVDGKCENVGVFYHPDCMKYNNCTVVGEVPGEVICPQNTYFDVNTELCLPVKCHGF